MVIYVNNGYSLPTEQNPIIRSFFHERLKFMDKVFKLPCSVDSPNASLCVSIHLSNIINSYILVTIYFIDLFIYPSIHPSIYSSIYLSIVDCTQCSTRCVRSGSLPWRCWTPSWRWTSPTARPGRGRWQSTGHRGTTPRQGYINKGPQSAQRSQYLYATILCIYTLRICLCGNYNNIFLNFSGLQTMNTFSKT